MGDRAEDERFEIVGIDVCGLGAVPCFSCIPEYVAMYVLECGPNVRVYLRV